MDFGHLLKIKINVATIIAKPAHQRALPALNVELIQEEQIHQHVPVTLLKVCGNLLNSQNFAAIINVKIVHQGQQFVINARITPPNCNFN